MGFNNEQKPKPVRAVKEPNAGGNVAPKVDDEEEKQKQIEKMRQQLRGKDYNYDENGNIYQIEKIPPSKLVSKKYEFYSSMIC